MYILTNLITVQLIILRSRSSLVSSSLTRVELDATLYTESLVKGNLDRSYYMNIRLFEWYFLLWSVEIRIKILEFFRVGSVDVVKPNEVWYTRFYLKKRGIKCFTAEKCMKKRRKLQRDQSENLYGRTLKLIPGWHSCQYIIFDMYAYFVCVTGSRICAYILSTDFITGIFE